MELLRRMRRSTGRAVLWPSRFGQWSCGVGTCRSTSVGGAEARAACVARVARVACAWRVWRGVCGVARWLRQETAMRPRTAVSTGSAGQSEG